MADESFKKEVIGMDDSKPVDESSAEVIPQQPKTNKGKKLSFSYRVPKGPADLNKLERKLIATMERHTNHMYARSAEGYLSKDEISAVPAYLRVLKDLKKAEAAAGNHMTEEELEAAAKETTSRVYARGRK